MHGVWVVTIALVAATQEAAAGERADAPERVALHFQATAATQAHPRFRASYTGPNSLRPEREAATSVVLDLFAGARLWPGAEVYLQPALSGGSGLSSTLGVAAFPSGEVYRVGDPAPTVFVGRLFLRQVIALGADTVTTESGQNQLGGARPRDAITLTAGKLAVLDVVDRVAPASDPHTQFSSFGLWASAAYDHPADTRGYTWGAAADLTLGSWSARAGIFLEPTTANGRTLDWRVTRARGLVAEIERRFTLGDRPGAARVLAFANRARMGSYRDAVDDATVGRDITATRVDGRTKRGFAASANQELPGGVDAFARVSWNDGATESWSFTEVERAVALGATVAGAAWNRPDDAAGLGVVASGLSEPHRRYLAAGGSGFLLGDGALRYGPEVLGEAWYRLALTREVSLSGHYQPIVNPGFNRDRGPVHVFTGLAHVEL